jgi:hypothetical protein
MTQINPGSSGPAGEGLKTVKAETESTGGFIGFVQKLFRFLGWVLTGFGIFGTERDHAGIPNKIIVYSVHRAFYVWLAVVLGFVGSAIVRYVDDGLTGYTSLVLGWTYVVVMIVTIVTLIFDFSTWKFLLVVGGFIFVWLLSKFLASHNIPVIGVFANYIASLNPRLQPGFASVMSWMLLMLWLGAAFHSFVRGRKTFMPNSVEEWVLGEGREVIDRQGVKFRTRYRDVLEAILGFGAGDIEAYDTTQHVVKRWENIVFLAFKWRQLDTLLHERMTYIDNQPGATIEVDEVKK